MSSSDSDHIDTTARALEAALARIGEPITEAQAREIAALEDCECKEGMFALATSRRALLRVAGAVAATGAAAVLSRPASAKAPPGAVEYPVQADSTKEQGRMMGQGDLLPLRRARNQQATNYCTRIASAFNITG